MDSENKQGQARKPHINEVRYSLKEMLEEVSEERRTSSLGRELVDSNEIGKLFSLRKRKKKD
jgi:hypothetical protein